MLKVVQINDEIWKISGNLPRDFSMFCAFSLSQDFVCKSERTG